MIRILSALFLTLALAVTSVTQAVARGQEGGLTEIVICANGMAVSVHVDAAGNLADPPAHHCPDCVLALAAPGPAAHPVRPPVPLRALQPAPVPAAEAPPAAIRAAPPRGPPVLS